MPPAKPSHDGPVDSLDLSKVGGSIDCHVRFLALSGGLLCRSEHNKPSMLPRGSKFPIPNFQRTDEMTPDQRMVWGHWGDYQAVTNRVTATTCPLSLRMAVAPVSGATQKARCRMLAASKHMEDTIR